MIPEGSSPLSPIRFRRNQEIYLSRDVQFYCSISGNTSTKWTIMTCTSPHCTNSIALNSTFSLIHNDLYIQQYILLAGLYEVRSEVTFHGSLQFNSSSTAYIDIVSTGIIVNLFPLGTSIITRGDQQNVQLNPGLHTLDSDGIPFNTSVNQQQKYFVNIESVII